MKEIFSKYRIFQEERGFTLFIALILMATLLLISFAISHITLKQLILSESGKDSLIAFYAANTGIECALYWDFKNSPESAFATSGPSYEISCGGTGSGSGPFIVGGLSSIDPNLQPNGTGINTFSVDTMDENGYCFSVAVTKQYSNPPNSTLKTTVESRGYNTCDTENPRRLERALRVRY